MLKAVFSALGSAVKSMPEDTFYWPQTEEQFPSSFPGPFPGE